MKISVIGAGNVGSLSAMRIAQEGLGEIVLLDVVKGLAAGKALDLEDARPILANHYSIQGTDQIEVIEGSDIVVLTAGLTRKPGMTREELLEKNARILQEICLNIKRFASGAMIIVVTNPLDLMTRLTLKITGFGRERVFGMGITLDSARFANLISQELNIPTTDIEAVVIGSHGEGMLPLPRLCNVKGVGLEEFLDAKKTELLVQRTVNRGQEIVSLLGMGSAFFAPSAAITAIVRAIVKDEKLIIGLSAGLNGEYGIRDVCIGVPCLLGRRGIERIVELELNASEKKALSQSAAKLNEQYQKLPL